MRDIVRAAGGTAPVVALVWALAGAATAAQPPSPDLGIFPPWRQDADDDALKRGLEFTVPEADDMADFHGDPQDAGLVLYVGGNIFFAMAPLVTAFERQHPEYRGKLFWETIPPGLLVRQMDAGGTITVGNMTFTAKPDAFFAGEEPVKALVAAGRLEAPAVPYATSDLTIMVPEGNPAQIGGLADLGQAGIKIAMPNPAFEGVAGPIKASLRKVGGDDLVKAVYETKVGNGATVLTQIHHRQTPIFLMRGDVQAGVTFRTEALYQERIKHPIGHVDIPDADNAITIYAGAMVKGAAHPEAAKAWLAFVASPAATAILQGYGFGAYRGAR